MLSSSSPSSTATSPAPITTAAFRQPRPNNLDFVPQRVDHALSWSSLMNNRPSQSHSQNNRRPDTSRQYQAVAASAMPMTASSTDSEGEAPAPRRRRLNPHYRRQQYTTAGPSRTTGNGASSHNNVADSSDEQSSNSGRVSCAEQSYADNQDAWADNESQSMRSESSSDSSAFEDEMSEEDDEDMEGDEEEPRRPRLETMYPNNLNNRQYSHPYHTGHYFRRNAPPRQNRPVFSPASSSSSLGSTYLQVVPYSAPTPTPASVPAPAPSNTLPQLENMPPLPQPPADYADQPPMVVNGEQVDPVQASNPNPGVLGIENLALFEVLRDWAARGYYGHQDIPRQAPDIENLLIEERRGVFDVEYEDLRADHCDFQGINWKKMKSTRFTGRMRRQQTYRNYVNRLGSDQWTVSAAN